MGEELVCYFGKWDMWNLYVGFMKTTMSSNKKKLMAQNIKKFMAELTLTKLIQ